MPSLSVCLSLTVCVCVCEYIYINICINAVVVVSELSPFFHCLPDELFAVGPCFSGSYLPCQAVKQVRVIQKGL